MFGLHNDTSDQSTAAELAEMANRVREVVEVGDAVLTGGQDPISRIIQIGSRSPFSHAAIVTGPDELTEAYDYALTPGEGDEGIFRLSFERFVNRSGLRRLVVLRPMGVDRVRVKEVADHLCHHSPSFPTIGMACLALCGASAPLLRVLPDELQHRVAMRQVRLAGDGPAKMHCAEAVARIYLESGVALRFRTPRLRFHIAHLAATASDVETNVPDPPGGSDSGGSDSGGSDSGFAGPVVSELPVEPRIATIGTWPGGRGAWRVGVLTNLAVRSAVETWRDRSRSDQVIDVADLILPGDFARAEPFRSVMEVVRSGGQWEEIRTIAPIGRINTAA